MYAHAAILEALLLRERTGRGSAIHVSLFGAMTDWMGIPLLLYDQVGIRWPRMGLGSPVLVPYGAFASSSGRLILVGVQNDAEWQRFALQVLRDPSLAADSKYHRNIDRVAHRSTIERTIQAAFRSLEYEEIAGRMKAARVAYAAVNEIPDVARHPSLRRTTIATPKSNVEIVAPPAQFRAAPRRLGAVPALGQHTESVLREFGDASK